ncbi:MAG: RrF2 family transcriptional regulator [Sulfobacillus sp.]
MALSRSCHTITPTAFGLAIQALVFLSLSENVCPSQQIAKMMKSGTTFMRRIMGPLVRANLVEAREGRDGGYILAKSAHVITVADVYRALQMNDPLGAGLLSSTTADCPNGKAIKNVFSEMATQAEKSVLNVYEQYTIEQIATRATGN